MQALWQQALNVQFLLGESERWKPDTKLPWRSLIKMNIISHTMYGLDAVGLIGVNGAIIDIVKARKVLKMTGLEWEEYLLPI